MNLLIKISKKKIINMQRILFLIYFQYKVIFNLTLIKFE